MLGVGWNVQAITRIELNVASPRGFLVNTRHLSEAAPARHASATLTVVSGSGGNQSDSGGGGGSVTVMQN
jgi:hypothetical protein